MSSWSSKVHYLELFSLSLGFLSLWGDHCRVGCNRTKGFWMPNIPNLEPTHVSQGSASEASLWEILCLNLQRAGSHDQIMSSEVLRVGSWEVQVGTLRHWLCTVGFLLLQSLESHFAIKSLQPIKSDSHRLSKITSQLIMDFIHSYKILSWQQSNWCLNNSRLLPGQGSTSIDYCCTFSLFVCVFF